MADQRLILKESEQKDRFLDLARELKKVRNMKVTAISVVIGVLSTVTKGLIKGQGALGNRRTSRDHLNDSIIKIGQNTEKSPANLRRIAVNQTPARNHPLTLL